MFSPLTTNEQKWLGLDFVDELEDAEIIQSAIVNIVTKKGDDATPNDVKQGTYLIQGTVVWQLIDASDGIIGNTYELRIVANTDNGQDIELRSAFKIKA